MRLWWLLACTGPEPFDPRADVTPRDWDDLEQRWARWEQDLEEALAEDDLPSVAAAVVIDGELAWSTALGSRILGASNLPVDTDTVYRWGSVSKMHTALGVLGLAEDGVWSLDDPITRHVADFELATGEASSVTLGRLLTHHGAVPDELDWDCDTEDGALSAYYAEWNPDLHGEAGAYYNYSNSGFNLLGAAIEQATDTPFPDWMAEQWLEPMGMETATFRAEETAAAARATGHAERSDGIREYSLVGWDCGVSRPAAWLHGSVEDLARSAAFFLEEGEGLLPTATVRGMADQADTRWWPDGSWRVGQGQFSWPYQGLQVVEHDGSVTGFASEWAIVPEAGLGLVVVANAEWAEVDVLLEAGLAAFLDPEEPWPPDYTTPETTWDRYAGRYSDPHVWGEVEVIWYGESLIAHFLDLDHEVALEQRAGDTFLFTEPDGTRQLVRFVFEQPDDPRPRWFVNRYGVATRGD